MKAFIFSILLILCFEKLCSQHLSLENLILLRQKNLGDVEEYLIKKGWEFKSSAPESDTSAAIAAYQNKFTSKSNLAIFQILYSTTDSFSRVWYTCLSSSIYQSFIVECKKLGFKFETAKTATEANSNLYSKKGLRLIFRTFVLGKSPNTTNLYRIELFNEDDYNKILPL